MTAAARAPVVIRDPTEDDLPAIREILAAHGNDGPVIVADVVGPYLRHLITRGGARVATDGGHVLGFAATIDAGRSVHLADLFVRPDRLGEGIGRQLLVAAFGDAPRRTTFASDDPRALPIYVRAGMRPLWASLYVEGPTERVVGLPASLTTAREEPTELATIERTWTGVDRTLDHAFWATQSDAEGFVIREGADIVAIAMARARQASTTRVLDRLVVHPDPAIDPMPITLAALKRAGRDGLVLAAIQGPNPVLRVLLDLGFRIADRDQFMASDRDLVDPYRLIPNPGML